MISLALPFVAALVLGAPPAGPCDLVDKAKITALLGQPATGEPSGPEKDEDTGGMMSYCSYRAGQLMVIVSNVVFANAAAARKATTQELVKARLDDETAKVTAEQGVADAGYWAESAKGRMYVVLKGARVVGVMIGGESPKPAATYHDALKDAAVTAASR